jgi:hypothetical protein
MNSTTAPKDPGKLEFGRNIQIVYAVLTAVGIASLLGGYAAGQSLRVSYAFLVALFFFASISLGGLFFTAVQHATNSVWSVTLRRICESLASFLPWVALPLLAYVFFARETGIYIWLDEAKVAADALLQKKTAYLNFGFFLVRVALFVGLWLFFYKRIVGSSIAQDSTKEEGTTIANNRISIVFLIIFALSYTLFSIDLLMSLEPHWYSTIFGVYCFAGLFQSALATTILITAYLLRTGKLTDWVNANHLHDIGKFLFAFTVFYAYIGFSQFMLIWYANIPEETAFYIHRSHGAWMTISMSLLVLKFIVPFLVLLPQGSKRSPKVLSAVAVLILIMQYVDVYWMAYPNLDSHHVTFGIIEIGVFLGFLGVFMFAIHRFLSRNNIVAIGDPRLSESLKHHVY